MTRPILRVCAVLILALGSYSCQTAAPKDDAASREAQVLENQKALVRTALDSGRPDSAMKSLRELLREKPNDPGLHNLMGLTQLALKNPGRAARHFKIAYKAEPQPAVALNLSSALIESGDYDNAIALLRGVLKATDKEGKPYQFKERVYHNMGYAFAKQNQNTKAAAHYKQALEENPTFFPSHLELARMHEKMKRPAMAVRSYRAAIDYCDVCFEPVQGLVAIYLREKKYADARRVLLTFSKNEGVTTTDKVAAERLLKHVTTAGLTVKQRGG